MSEEALLKTPMHALHVAAAAKFCDAAGWEMPQSFGSLFDEVAQARNRAAVFDMSHVGRIHVRGNGALDLLERVCTADVARQEDDTARFTLLCNDAGGILADGFLLRLADYWLVTVDPNCRPKVLEHLASHGGDLDVKVSDQTDKTAMVAAVGPQAGAILDAVLPFGVSNLPTGAVKAGSLMVARYLAARVSISGQWGIEVTIPNMIASQAWRFITSKAGKNAIHSAGLATRDVLRIEAGVCRYGYELNETVDPFMAGLGWAVDSGHDFIGAGALAEIKRKGPRRVRVGLRVEPKAEGGREVIAAQGSPVLDASGEIGAITSATFSPTLDATIAQAYVRPDVAAAGAELTVQTPTGSLTAGIVPMPFVKGLSDRL